MNEDKTPRLKKLSGFFKIGFISALFYAGTSGACPCCGAPAAACGTSLSALGIIGLFSSGFYYSVSKVHSGFRKISSLIKKPFSRKEQ